MGKTTSLDTVQDTDSLLICGVVLLIKRKRQPRYYTKQPMSKMNPLTKPTQGTLDKTDKSVNQDKCYTYDNGSLHIQ